MSKKVFLFGDIGSGKSTISATLLKYLKDREGAALQLDVGNPDGAIYYQDWMAELEAGNFPVKTNPTRFLHVSLGVYLSRSKERFGLSFFEASGEELVKISPLESDHASLRLPVKTALEEADVVVLVIPFDASRVSLERMHAFVSVLIANQKCDLPVAFVISHWDRVGGRVTLKYLVKTTFNDSLSLLNNASFSDFELFTFSVGVVDRSKITSLRYANGAASLLTWILEKLRERA